MEGAIWNMMEIGAIFCHVSKMSPEMRGIPWVTSGTHRWKGARPIFIDKATVNIKEDR